MSPTTFKDPRGIPIQLEGKIVSPKQIIHFRIGARLEHRQILRSQKLMGASERRVVPLPCIITMRSAMRPQMCLSMIFQSSQ